MKISWEAKGCHMRGEEWHQISPKLRKEMPKTNPKQFQVGHGFGEDLGRGVNQGLGL